MIFLLVFIFCIMSHSLGEEWVIHVYTGKEHFAGTDNNVFIRLFNSKHGYSHEYELSNANWIFGRYEFPLKNLFEYGAHDRFKIFTERIETVEIIHVRHENIPLLQSDWFLDRIIIERIRDSTKFTFECNCWFRKEQPDINISALSDLQSNDKNNSWKTNLTIVIILIISVALITCIMCCTDKYCQHRGFSSVHTQQESSILDRYHLQLPEPSAPPFVDNTITPWKDIRNTLPSDNDASVVIVRPTTVNSTDEPPAYTDLFPN